MDPVQLFFSPDLESIHQALTADPELGKSDIRSALMSGEVDIVESWLKDHDVNQQLSPENWVPLTYAVYSHVSKLDERSSNCERVIKLLLDKGADPNSTHKTEGWELPALYGATCVVQHYGIAKLLLQVGANPDDSESVYHGAQLNLRDMLALLKEHGADLSHADPQWHNTPLYFNAGHIEGMPGAATAMKGMHWLLENGADPNVLSYDCKETPLHPLCRNGWSGEDIEFFLQHGADPEIRNAHGLKPVDYAALTGNTSAAAALGTAGSRVSAHIPNWLVQLLNGDVTPEVNLDDIPAELRSKLLIMNAQAGNARGVHALVLAGIDPNVADEKGVTALHWAGYLGHSLMAKQLLEQGANLAAVEQNYQGQPLDWALHAICTSVHTRGDYDGTVQILLNAGAPREPLDRRLNSDDLTNEQKERLRRFVSN